MSERKSSTTQSQNVKPSTWPQVFCAIAAGFSSANQGVCVTYPSRALTQWENESDPELQMNLEDVSWFASLHMACAILCCPLGGLMSNRIGRRKTLIWLSIPCFVGWILIAVAPNRHILFLGKFLTAISSTGMSSSVGVYISETAHPSLRGSLAVFQSLFISLGMLIVFAVGYFVDWRTLAWLCGIPGALCFLSMIFLPESPYWLVENQHNSCALKSLQFLRGKDYDANEELNEMINRRLEKEAKAKTSVNSWTWMFRRLASPAYFRPFVCLGFIKIIMQWGGNNIIMIYMVNVFRSAKSSIDPELAPVFVGIVRVISSAFSSLIMRKAHRKMLFMICMSITVTGNVLIATYSLLKSRQEEDGSPSYLDNLGWLPLAVIICTLTAHSMGCLPVIQLLSGELYPTDIRPLCVGLTHSIASAFGAINVKTYPYQLESMQFHGTFYMYAGANLAAVLWAAFTIPDNRGLSLVKVEQNYEKKSKQRDDVTNLQVSMIEKA